jgi:hypothetical protein
LKRTLSVVLGLICLLVLSTGQAEAKKKKKGGARGPEKAFSGKILFSKKRFPTSASSPGSYTAKLKKQRTDKFWENKAKKEWKVYYAAFFKRKYNDLEVTIKLWDVTTGKKQLGGSFEQYLDKRGERVIISYVTLERKYFGVNKKILMTVEDHRGTVYAQGSFRILGEGEKYTGSVSFTEEETKGEIDYDDDKKDE